MSYVNVNSLNFKTARICFKRQSICVRYVAIIKLKFNNLLFFMQLMPVLVVLELRLSATITNCNFNTE